MSVSPASTTDGARSLIVPYRARFDECGPDGLVRSSALLRYAQDLAWIHSERLGFTRDWYTARNLAWVVRCAELTVLLPLPLGQTISLRTEVIGFRRVWARRRTEGRLADGTLALWGNTDWVIVDAERGVPGRFPPEFLARFEGASQTFEPGRVTLPAMPTDGGRPHRSLARPQDTDPMGHVNNAAYLDYFEEALLTEGGEAAALTAALPRRFRLEYVVPASPGTEVLGTVWPLAGHEAGCAWRLDDEGGRELARGLLTREAVGEA